MCTKILSRVLFSVALIFIGQASANANESSDMCPMGEVVLSFTDSSIDQIDLDGLSQSIASENSPCIRLEGFGVLGGCCDIAADCAFHRNCLNIQALSCRRAGYRGRCN